MLNHVEIQGRLGHDPELKEFDGKNGPYSRVSFSIANDRPYGDETDWIRCYMNGKRAEIIHKFFKKGSQIIVEGRLETYKTSDGTKHFNIRMSDFHFVGSRTESAPEGFVAVENDEDFNLF